MTDRTYLRPVVPLLISVIAGITVGVRFPGFQFGACLVTGAGGAWIISAIIRDKTLLAAPLALLSAVGYLSIQPWVQPAFPANHVFHYIDSPAWSVSGVIDSPATTQGDLTRFVLKSQRLDGGGSSFAVTGRIRVTVRSNDVMLSTGDGVSFTGRLRLIRGFRNPGGFNYQQYMAFNGIWVTAFAFPNTLTVKKGHQQTGLLARAAKYRSEIMALIENVVQDPAEGVLKALIVGDRNAVLPEVREAFVRAGVAHVLAISGLHVGIVAGAAFFIFRWLLCQCRFVLWRAWTQKAAALLTLIPVFSYGLLAGMSPSTQRAVIMVAVFVAALLIDREHDPLNCMAVAAMLILVVHPPALYSISFQLSFAAVFAILYGLPKLPRNHSPAEGRLNAGKKVLTFLATSLLAIAGTLPLVMTYFNLVSLAGLLTNFLVIPLIGCLVIPLGFLSLVLYPFSSHAAASLLQASAWILNRTIDLVGLIAAGDFSAVHSFAPTLFEIGCFYLLFWTVLNFKKVKHAKYVALAVILACGVDAYYWTTERIFHEELRVTVLDVGQGSAALLELPGGYNMIFDGGGYSDNSVFDIGARVIAPLLRRRKISTVDTLVLSHPNSDHLNGLIHIARHFNVKEVWTNNEAAATHAYANFLEVVARNGIHMPVFRNMARRHLINGVELEILHPPRHFADRDATETWRTVNNNSLVLKINFGSHSFLFPGDIDRRVEKEMADSIGEQLHCTVLVAPHHGSAKSGSSAFLECVKPEIAIISVGWKNRFGFPHPSALRRYQEHKVPIYRTDHHGAIRISTDGQTLDIVPTIVAADPQTG